MKSIKVSACKEDWLKEFPHLKFYKTKNDEFFFDASEYLKKKQCIETHSVEGFQSLFSYWTNSANHCYGISIDQLFVINEENGHILIDESMVFLFLAYIDHWFAMYILERMKEMFTTGIVLSDTMILYLARQRFSSKDIQKLLEEEADEENVI